MKVKLQFCSITWTIIPQCGFVFETIVHEHCNMKATYSKGME